MLGRATQGVKLINLKGKDSIAAVSIIKDGKQQRLEDAEDVQLDDSEEGEEENPETEA